MQVSTAIREKVATTVEIVAEQHKESAVAKPAAVVGVGIASVVAAGTCSNELVDALCGLLGYPFDLVVPGGSHACSTASLLFSCLSLPCHDRSSSCHANSRMQPQSQHMYAGMVLSNMLEFAVSTRDPGSCQTVHLKLVDNWRRALTAARHGM